MMSLSEITPIPKEREAGTGVVLKQCEGFTPSCCVEM